MVNKKGRVPNRLKKYRLMHGLSQIEVAHRLGMSKSNLISEWEKGTVIPKLSHLFDLASLYGTLIEELYFDYYQYRKKHICKKDK